MEKDSLMVKQINFVIIVRRIKILGLAITVGMIAIYVFGLFVAGSNVKENFEIVNLLTLVFLVITVPLAVFIKKIMLRKIKLSDFSGIYFNAHIISFMIIDFGALFCITTNLFVNGNILYASIGIVIAVAGIISNFPKEEDFEKIKQVA